MVIPKKISIFALLIKKTKTNMKKFFIVMAMVAMCVACGNDKADTTKDTPIVNATEIVPAAATDVIPCAAPGPDAGGKVATEVIPNE